VNSRRNYTESDDFHRRKHQRKVVIRMLSKVISTADEDCRFIRFDRRKSSTDERRTFVTVRPTAFRPVESTIRPWETESAADLPKVQYPWKEMYRPLEDTHLRKTKSRLAFRAERSSMGAGTGGAGWASAHPGKNQGGHGPPWKF